MDEDKKSKILSDINYMGGVVDDSTMESKVTEGMDFLVDPKDQISLMSDISPEEAVLLAKLRQKGRLRRDRNTHYIIEEYLKLKVSVGRKGRIELVDTIKGMATAIGEMKTNLAERLRPHA
jgi:hypothetical protein